MANDLPPIFIKRIKLEKIRHLKDIEIPLGESSKRSLILTGENGSGKTSILHTVATHLSQILGTQETFAANDADARIGLSFSSDTAEISKLCKDGEVVCSMQSANRRAQFNTPSGVTDVSSTVTSQGLKLNHSVHFIQYLVNLKAEGSFARDDGDTDAAAAIENWFGLFENRLKQIYFDETLQLVFDRKNFSFAIKLRDRDPFPLDKLSDGYSSIIRIVAEIILRMEAHGRADHQKQGFVFIDEIETHLHIELQKVILPFLLDFFPNIQFIVTTHSPFVLSSTDQAVVFDLEHQEAISDLSAYSSEAIVESYFDSDKYSILLKKRITELEKLVESNGHLSEKQRARRDELFDYFTNSTATIGPELEVKIQDIRLKRLTQK